MDRLRAAIPLGGSEVAVPLRSLPDILTVLDRVPRDVLDVVVSPDIRSLKQVAMPSEFGIWYEWSPDHRRIERQITPSIAYFGAGWFVAGDAYWHVAEIAVADDPWLCRDAIEGEAIIPFLTQILPRWRERGLPFSTALTYDPDSVLTLTITRVTDDEVTIDTRWDLNGSSQIEAIPSLYGHVRVLDAIRPGVTPAQLSGWVPPQSGEFHLIGQNIPRFFQEIGRHVQPWICGQVEDLANRHLILTTACELVLSVHPQDREGVGVPIGVPTVICGDLRLSADELSRRITPQTRYLRTDRGWLSIAALQNCQIGSAGRFSDGTLIKTVTLSPVEVLQGSCRRPNAHWTRVEFPTLNLPAPVADEDQSRHHLQFLQTWGIPGGIVGAIRPMGNLMVETLFGVALRHPSARILVVGTRKALDSLDRRWRSAATARLNGHSTDPTVDPRWTGVILVATNGINAHPELRKVSWTILCVLEVDHLVRSPTSPLQQALVTFPSGLVLGLFCDREFVDRSAARQALTALFRVSADDAPTIWTYGVRDSARPVPALPDSRADSRDSPSRSGAAEFTIQGPASQRSVPIPPRAPTPAPASWEKSALRPGTSHAEISIALETSDTQFVKEARAMVNKSEGATAFVPFEQYYPTYGSMTVLQRRWYLYWRTQVRTGHYPDTDLSYIFLHLYELLNNVGVKNPDHGLRQLWHLWQGYRARFEKLDRYLVDWLVDYALVNRCSVDPLTVYRDAFVMGAELRQPDVVVGFYLDALDHFPVSLLDHLVDHGIRRGRFYQNGNAQLVDEMFPKALAAVDAHLIERHGAGIFALYAPHERISIQRTPFQGALAGGTRDDIVIATVTPYSTHPPLRAFLTSVVKHAENDLRQRVGFSGRLQETGLDAEIQAVIDAVIGATPHAGLSPRPTIVIDPARISTLQHESDEILGLLRTETDESDISWESTTELGSALSPLLPALESNGCSDRSTIIPSDDPTPSSESTDDLDEWASFVATLTDVQSLALRAISLEDDVNGRLRRIGDEHAVMPSVLIDGINEVALAVVGDLVVTDCPIPFITPEYRESIQDALSLPH